MKDLEKEAHDLYLEARVVGHDNPVAFLAWEKLRRDCPNKFWPGGLVGGSGLCNKKQFPEEKTKQIVERAIAKPDVYILPKECSPSTASKIITAEVRQRCYENCNDDCPRINKARRNKVSTADIGRVIEILEKKPLIWETCPHCEADLKHLDGSRVIAMEVPGIYDGELYFECPDCGGRWHRWPEGHRLRELAEPYVKSFWDGLEDVKP